MYQSNEPYTLEGYWTFSKEQACWFTGTLKYSPKNHKIELRMWGSGEKVDLNFQTDTIIGRTIDNKKITLLNCLIKKSSSEKVKNGVNGKTSHFVVEASRILIGEQYNNINEISYSSLNISYSNQFDFIQHDGFARDISRKELLINYKKPDDIVLLKNNNIEVKIWFYGQLDRPQQAFNALSILQYENFTLTFPEKHNLQFLKNEINFLQYLITFSINKNISPLKCSFTTEENDSDEIKYADIYLLDRSFMGSKSKQDTHHRHRNILGINDFYNLPDLYEKWRLLCHEKESAIYKFFPTIYDDNKFLDEHFHKLVMAFEDYHRNSPEYFQKVTYTNKNKKNVKKTISLRGRIENVFEKFEKPLFYLFKNPNEQDRIIKLIKDTRDYLTHGGDVNKEKAVKDPNSYFDLSDLLISIISLMILNDLGFSEDTIADKIWNLPSYYGLVEKDWLVVR